MNITDTPFQVQGKTNAAICSLYEKSIIELLAVNITNNKDLIFEDFFEDLKNNDWKSLGDLFPVLGEILPQQKKQHSEIV